MKNFSARNQAPELKSAGLKLLRSGAEPTKHECQKFIKAIG
jgi:hypothetical protein